MEVTPEKRKIGTVTTSSTAGGVLAGAITVLIVYGVSFAGVDVPEHVSGAITVVVSAVGALAGGWLVKPGGGKRRAE